MSRGTAYTPTLLSSARTGTGNSVAFVSTGTKVAVTSFTFKSDAAASLGVVEDGAGVNHWVVELAAAGTVTCTFSHPLLLDGLGVVLSGGTARRWSISWREI